MFTTLFHVMTSEEGNEKRTRFGPYSIHSMPYMFESAFLAIPRDTTSDSSQLSIRARYR
jgi:hypothetical protein